MRIFQSPTTKAVTDLISPAASAASGGMGTGTPHFGVYSAATGTEIKVWASANATVPFPAGCTLFRLTPETMDIETCRAAVAILTAARATDMRVRFFAHGERDGGCGADYV
jgi:hypothetical protein